MVTVVAVDMPVGAADMVVTLGGTGTELDQ